MLIPPLNNPEVSRVRLDKIMSRRRLSFNPYTVSDRRLMEVVNSTGWGSDMDIVQMVIVRFLRLRLVPDYRKFDGIIFNVGENKEEIFLPTGSLIYPITANDSHQGERSTYGSRSLCNPEDIGRLVGRTVFVSRTIRGTDINGNGRVAYRMHPLRGDIMKQATTIREAMIKSKIEMLERILTYPENPDFLSCRRGLIEYEPRIHQAIEVIRKFPETPIPKE
ncbi:MAG: hypothetical protein K2L89_03155 [Muribaculaceae bacterium]|nr:hypothetical protein [Muribaculaceae bacterium]